MSLLIFIIILVALIWVHELGHFVAAKLFGVRVDEFAIGFPPRLLKVRFGETDYTFNLLLVGGFVRIFGEYAGEGVGNPRSLTSRPRWQQAIVMVAGIAMNVIFAWLALSAGYMAGLPTSVEHKGIGTVYISHPTIVGVLPGSPAEKSGLKGGDIVEKVQTAVATLDVRTLSTQRQAEVVQGFIAEHQDESIVVTVLRDGAEETFLTKGEEGLVEGRKAIGIQLDNVGLLTLPPHLALVQGAIIAKDMTIETAQGLGGFLYKIFRGSADLSQVAGPIGIAGAGANAVTAGFAATILITALISINLAIINILPIPGLDGGRLLVISIESIIRRPVPERLLTYVTLGGFLLLIALMVAVSAHDIARLVG